MTSCVAITGLPGVGKTTLIKRLTEDLKSRAIPFSGFYTEETRDPVSKKRTGFDIVTLSGQRGTLARHTDAAKIRSKHKVGQYNVFLEDLEHLTANIFTSTTKLVIIDEIGNMELMSQVFCRRMDQLMAELRLQKRQLIVTVPVENRRNHKIIDDLKQSGVLFTVIKGNRDVIYDEIFAECLKLK